MGEWGVHCAPRLMLNSKQRVALGARLAKLEQNATSSYRSKNNAEKLTEHTNGLEIQDNYSKVVFFLNSRFVPENRAF